MKKSIGTLFLATAMLFLLGATAFGQTQFGIPVTFTNGTNTTIVTFGVSGDGPGGAIEDNTRGIDIGAIFGAYEESELPPAPPTPVWEVRFSALPGDPSLGTGLGASYYGFTSSGQVDAYKVDLFGTAVTGAITISWPANIEDFSTTCTLQGDLLDPGIGVVDMIATTSVVVPNGALLAAADIRITKTGAFAPSPGPTFSITPAAPLNFGSVPVGGSSTIQATVTNIGSANTLTITSAPTTPANFTIVPNPPIAYPINITALGSYNFDITFSPVASGAQGGDIVFTHNAPGSPTAYAVTGTGVTQGGTLDFSTTAITRFDNTVGYTEKIALNGYVGSPLKALQFEFVTNGLLILRSITKGSDISAPGAWNFNYVLSRGPVNDDGSSNDTVKVVLYGNGTTTLAPGTYPNLFDFTYDVVNISDPDMQTTTIAFDDPTVAGSLVDGTNAGIIAGTDQTVTVNNRTLLGDVNDDDVIDILDLLEVVDHILEIDLLSPDEFIRANIAPWTIGAPAPTPDAVVNVQDLAVIQNIILTGVYPSGEPAETPVSIIPLADGAVSGGKSLAKLEAGMDAKLTFHVTRTGIAVRLETAVPVKGIQLEFADVTAPELIEITTLLGQGFYLSKPGELTVLLYNQAGGSAVQPGEAIVANLPFDISDPGRAKVTNVVLADMNNQALKNVGVEISLFDAPELPTEFALEQNYPNPFNPTTNIRFSVPELANVRISIYNLLGQEIRTLLSDQVDRGTRIVEWNGKDNSGRSVPTGTYIYRMTADGFSQANKMLLLK